MIRWCNVHPVRLRLDGECRICTLEAHEKKTFEDRRLSLPVLARNNDWEFGTAKQRKQARSDNFTRGNLEAITRKRTLIDHHPGYPVNNREQWEKDEAYRKRVGVRGYQDECWKALPEGMRQWLGDRHGQKNVEGIRIPHMDWLRPQQRNLVYDVIVLFDSDGGISDGWQFGSRMVLTQSGRYVDAWRAVEITAESRRRGSRIRGMRERVHQPFFDTLTQGLGVSTVQNNVQLFGQANMAEPLPSEARYVVKAIHVDPPPGFIEALRGEGDDDADEG